MRNANFIYGEYEMKINIDNNSNRDVDVSRIFPFIKLGAKDDK